MTASPDAGRPRRVSWLACAALLLAPSGAPASTPQAPLGLDLIFIASGARDTTGIATVVFCTNIGSQAANFGVAFAQFNGTSDCNLGGSLPAGATRIIATRNTVAFAEDFVCAAPPGLVQGVVAVGLDQVANAVIICSALVVDSAAATPTFATAIDVTPAP